MSDLVERINVTGCELAERIHVTDGGTVPGMVQP
jgi:hypothetical protein